MLGDGGLQRKNGKTVGFGFGQRSEVAEYADWKAAVFSTHGPKLRVRDSQRRYETPYGRYFRHLSDRFPTKTVAEHFHRKAVITEEVLANLGDLGLVVWYQDDGTLVGKEQKSPNSRIYAVLNATEQALVLAWLSAKLGTGVTYSKRGRFLQFTGAAFRKLQALAVKYGHPAMAYKMVKRPTEIPKVSQVAGYFCEEIREVVKLDQSELVGRGRGVRYCLTVEDAGNFLTKAGFVSNCYDADVTRRIYTQLRKLVIKDHNGHDCREPYWRNHRASLAVLEMEMEGVIPDPERIMELAQKFASVRNELIADLRKTLCWPTFNPASDTQCRAMLFGDKYSRKMAPPGIPSFRLLDGEAPAEGVKRVLSMLPTPFDARIKELEEFIGDIPKKDPILKTPYYKPSWQELKSLRAQAKKYQKDNPPTHQFAEQQWIYLLPEGAIGQNLPPILSTGKRKKLWSKIVEAGTESEFSPSTDKTVLGILAERSLVAAQLRDTRFLGQMLATTLRRPDVDKKTGEYLMDDDENFIYEKGLLSYLSSDGRVHGRQRQDKETGRGSMSKPNLQAISSRREDNYRKIMGYLEETDDGPVHRGSYIHLFPEPLYTTSVKSIFIPPPMHVFMESDFTGAEIAGIMWLSQDPQGIEDVRRNLLPEDHPDYQDIHSMMAVRAFKLDCAPTKKALKKLNKSSLRTAAKGVVFGTPYGISAQAIAMACLAEGTPCTIDEAQAIIDYYFERYPAVKQQLDECVARVYNPGHICGVFGRRRRFPWTDDEKVRSDQERQAKNFRIQNLVADAVWTALGNMYEYRERRGNPNLFKFSLQIHDAIRLAVPFEHVPEVYRNVFPECMFNGVAVWPCDFDGRRLPLPKPYYLQGSREIGFRAGEGVDELQAEKLGADAPSITKLLENPENDAEVVAILHKLAAC
jgi:DNA polymerase I-like protein with 3'-5' exonuclease and polymerase domains